MGTLHDLSTAHSALVAAPHHPAHWIRDGWQMARREHDAAFDSITAKHDAESRTHAALIERLKAHGRALLDERNVLDAHLAASHFNAGEHLKALAHGRMDLLWA